MGANFLIKKKLFFQYIAFVFIFIMSFYRCGPHAEKSIAIDGSSTVYPITEAVAEEFREVSPAPWVTIGVSGTGGGFAKFCRGRIDINNASRAIQPGEIKLCKQNNIEYVELSVAYDGITIVVNPKNTWVDYLTVEELKKIWEPDAQGKITKWSQVRDGWPEKPIHLYGAGTASGTYDYFTEVIVGEAGASRGDFVASEDDNILVKGVATDLGALGFFGYAYYEENNKKLKVVPVDNGKGPVTPTRETISNGTYSPLSRPLFIYVTDKAAQKEAVQKFVNFYLTDATPVVRDVGYIVMPKRKYQKQKEKFSNFITKQISKNTSRKP